MPPDIAERERERERAVCFTLICVVAVCVLYLFPTESRVALESVIVVFPGHTHIFLFENVEAAKRIDITLTNKMD